MVRRRFRADEHQQLKATRCLLRQSHRSAGQLRPAGTLCFQRVVKGGSFLCHVDYCEIYRPSARRDKAPDTGVSHISFRCIKSLEAVSVAR